MKKRMTLILAAALVFAGSAAFAGIDGSKHDLASWGAQTGYPDEICVYCHTPHGGNPAVPLWNRTNPTTSTFTVYTSQTMDALPGSSLTGTVSGMCMSCHDGATGIASGITNWPNNLTAETPSASTMTDLYAGSVAILGADLANDHPVNVDYVSGGTTEMNNPPSQSYTKLYNNKVQCASCHDPHDTTYAPFLVASNTNSAICLSCHLK